MPAAAGTKVGGATGKQLLPANRRLKPGNRPRSILITQTGMTRNHPPLPAPPTTEPTRAHTTYSRRPRAIADPGASHRSIADITPDTPCPCAHCPVDLAAVSSVRGDPHAINGENVEMTSSVDLLGAYVPAVAPPFDGDASGMEILAKIGAADAVIGLPRLVWRDERPVVEAPTVVCSDPFAWQGLLKRSENETIDWGKAAAWKLAGPSVQCWWAKAITLRWAVTSDDIQYSETTSGRRGSPVGPLVDSLFGAVDEWYLLLSKWIEAIGPFDMGLHGRLPDSSIAGEGLELLALEDGVTSIPAGPRWLSVMGGIRRGLTPDEWQLAVKQASAGDAPPEEYALLSDARAALRRHQHRRAVIDAGTAVELALMRQLEASLAGLENGTRRALMAEHRTLGRLVDVIKRIAELPADILPNLVTLRNKAAHKNMDPGREGAERAVAIGEDVVTRVVDVRAARCVN